MQRCHRRSNVETTFSLIKGKLGERLRGKSDTGRLTKRSARPPKLNFSLIEFMLRLLP